MKKRRVVHYRSLPDYLPLQFTAVMYLLGDRFHWPEWAWTLAILLVVVRWIAFFMNVASNVQTESFKDDERK